MKTRFFRSSVMVSGVASLVWLSGCQKSDVRVQTAPPAPTNTTSVVAVANAPTALAPTETPKPVEPPPRVSIESSDAAKPPVPNLKLSPPLLEVVRLAHANVGDQVLREFIAGQNFHRDLTADEIVFLKDLGISDDVVTAIMHRRKESVALAQTQSPQPPPQVETAAPQPAPAPTAVATTSLAPAAPEAPPVAPPPQINNYYYESLTPYGTWLHVSDYGWCWRPTVASLHVGWRPYCDGGRWQWTDYGWYWQSDYSWGWAPFHYGRWHLSGHHGWIWTPGHEWAPAWVTWRSTSSYCGWAPLPPGAHFSAGVGFTYHGAAVSVGFGFGLGHAHFNFVPLGRLHHHNPRGYVLPSTQTVQAYNNSTVINNYVVGNNNTIVNGGISADQIRNVTHTEIRKVNIREIGAGEAAASKADRLERNGATLAVYKPQVPAQAPMPPSGLLKQPSGRNERGVAREAGGPNAAIIPSLAGIPLAAPSNVRQPSGGNGVSTSGASGISGVATSPAGLKRMDERSTTAAPVNTFVPQRNANLPSAVPARNIPRAGNGSPTAVTTFPSKREESRGGVPTTGNNALPPIPAGSFARQAEVSTPSAGTPPAAIPNAPSVAAPTVVRNSRSPGAYNSPAPAVVQGGVPNYAPAPPQAAQSFDRAPSRPTPGVVNSGRSQPFTPPPAPAVPVGRPTPGASSYTPPPAPSAPAGRPTPGVPSYTPPPAPVRSYEPPRSAPAPAPAPARAYESPRPVPGQAPAPRYEAPRSAPTPAAPAPSSPSGAERGTGRNRQN